MLKLQTHNHHFIFNTTTDKRYILRKMGLKFKNLPHFFQNKILYVSLLKNRIPLELREQEGHSETNKNDWICVLQFRKKLKLHTKLFPETVH